MRILFLSLLLVPFAGLAQTNVGGIISTNTTWSASGNPYIVNDHITINENVTLNIEPGVILKFNQGNPQYNIYVYGTFRAIGTESSIITFTSNESLPEQGDWGAVIFYDESEDYDFDSGSGCILQYCKFEYSGSCHDWYLNSIFIYMQYSSPFIDHCIYANSGTAFISAMWLDSELRITNNKFLSNHNGHPMIWIHSDYAPTDISYNLFYDNRDRMATMVGNCSFHHNLVIANKAGGCHVEKSDQYHHNTFVDNYEILRPVYNLGKADYNTFVRNVFETSEVNGPAGVIDLLDSNAIASHNNFSQITFKNPGYNFILRTWVERESYFFTPIDGTNNWFNETSPVEISYLIEDYFDDTTRYSIDFQPFLLSPETDAPVTPPTGVNKIDLGGGNVKVAWNPNPDADVVGYKIYWGDFTGYSFSNSIDVGNVTSYTLTGVNSADTIGVTAYDADADGSLDQYDGNESWFTYDYMFTGVSEIPLEQGSFQCYPNPADEYTVLNISDLKQDTHVTVRVTSGLGEHIKTFELRQGQYPVILVSDLASGIYMMSIYRDDGIAGHAKLVIAR